MKVPDNSSRGGTEFNMTPMIDVVFLLIIFFLVSSHLAKQEVHMDLPLPVAASGQDAINEDKPRVTINVLANGTLMFAGREVPITELGSRLATRLANDGANLEVRIRSDRNAPYKTVEPILRTCAKTGVWNVTFAVYSQEANR